MKEIYRLLISLLVGFISFWIMYGFAFGQCFQSRGNENICQILNWANLVVPIIAFLATFLFLRYKEKQSNQQQAIDNNQQSTAIATDNSLVFIVIAYMCLVVPLFGYLSLVLGLAFGYVGFRKTKSQNGRVFALIAIILLSIRLIAYVIAIYKS